MPETLIPIPKEEKILEELKSFLSSRGYTQSIKKENQNSVTFVTKKFRERKNSKRLTVAYFNVSVECTGWEDA